MTGDQPPYRFPTPIGTLRQGEILSSLEQYIVDISQDPVESQKPVNTTIRTHPFAVILTQDCDLTQDYSARIASPPQPRQLLTSVLLCEVDIAENMKNGGTIAQGSDIWKRIVQNKDDRFQYLGAIPAEQDGEGTGTKPLLIDFKRVFTLPTEMLYVQLERRTKRRTVLVSPYLEHLSSRYAYFCSRVALPRDHHNLS